MKKLTSHEIELLETADDGMLYYYGWDVAYKDRPTFALAARTLYRAREAVTESIIRTFKAP